jgi:hypothetical protein
VIAFVPEAGMIPPFEESGFLPAGIHQATLLEFEARFAIFDSSDRRIKLYNGIKRLWEAAHKLLFVKRLYVAGSYVSSKPEPNDFDCLVVYEANEVPQVVRPFEYQVLHRKTASKHFAGDVITVGEGSELHRYYMSFLQLSRDDMSVGIVEIEL